jgi:phototropin
MNSLSVIRQKYLSDESPLEVGLPSGVRKDFIQEIENCTTSTLPALTDDIIKSKTHIETLLLTDSYPMFVKHQMTTNVREALAKSKNEYHGLGDCFCMTDPK